MGPKGESIDLDSVLAGHTLVDSTSEFFDVSGAIP